MRWRLGRGWRLAAAAGVLATAPACSQLRSTLTVTAGDDGPVACPPDAACADHAKVCHNPTVHNLACDLDHLERHIEWYGSVTAKAPDVWGQARLTQYREDFEREMKGELTGFNLELQGNTARSDQSYLAAALSLGLAAQPTPPAIGSLTTGAKTFDAPAPAVPVLQAVNTVTTTVDDRTGTTIQSTETRGLPATPAPPAPAAPPPPVTAVSPGDPAALVSKAGDVIKRTDKVELKTFGYAGATAGIGIEPAERLAQKKRYLDLLGQLRRENEGSDTADAPGYQLNLVRLPVSILPGAHTDRGHGAEVTFTVDPVLGDDLLPTTFRNLVTNDLLHQLGFPLTQILNDPVSRDALTDRGKRVVVALTTLKLINQIIREAADDTAATQGVLAYLRTLSTIDLQGLGEALDDSVSPGADNLKKLVTDAKKGADAAPPASPAMKELNTLKLSNVAPDPGQTLAATVLINKPLIPPISYAPGLVNKTGFPTSQLVDVFGLYEMYAIGLGAKSALVGSITRQGYAHLPDVQAFLQQEAQSAYRFLAEPECRPLWDEFCTPDLVSLIRTRKVGELQDLRTRYRTAVEQITRSTPDQRRLRPYNQAGQFSVTAALAWAIIVDSALLNDRLVRDMRESATAKGQAVPCPADAWPCFFLPDPPPDARGLFNAYVKLRWPVYVFALDPTAQEQNIADSLSTRRETQLALAVGFTNGAVSARTFLNAARRLEAEYQTVALNRTQVGFAHGENTFGWRFYPRFQTPPTQSNLTVLFRDQLIGGPTPDALLRQRRLEPGPRECVALVIMPSFVPYVTVDAVSNWFRLPNPKHKALDHTQAMHLSKAVRTLERCQHTVTDADCYRDHELKRLQTRVQQLASRLPAQTLTVPVPVVNTLGGFEMFSNGTTDLAPELYGWYGAPGVSADAESTTLFLVGDHFSPLQTRVIVGNAEVAKDVPAGTPPAVRMLSRQVMQVTVKKTAVVPFIDPADGVRKVQAHVATPYGVSRELLIPLVSNTPAEKPKPVEGYTVRPDAVRVTYNLVPSRTAPGAHQFAAIAGADPGEVQVVWDDATGSVPKAVEVRFVFEYGGKEVPTPACNLFRLDETGNKFVMTKDKLMTLAHALILAVQPDGLKPGANPFDTPFVTKRIEVTPVKSEHHAVQTKLATTPLTLTLVGQYAEVCPPVVPPAEPLPSDQPAPPPPATK